MTALVAEDVTVRYGANVAVDAVSLTVEPGSIVGLIGPNGAGKTSLIDAASGITPMAGGRIALGGRDVTGWAPYRRARAGLRRTFQALRLFDDLTIAENLVVAAETDTPFGLLRDLVRPRSVTVGIERALDLTGLSDRRDEYPRSLPAGTRRLVGVARAVVSVPSALLLDEPAAGLDTAETGELGAVLTRLAGEGVGMLLVEHDTSLVFRVCSSVVAIDFGRQIAAGPAAEVRQSDALVTAYLGTPLDGDAAS